MWNKVHLYFIYENFTVAFEIVFRNIPAMITITDTQERLEQIDRQIIKLIEDRTRINSETDAEPEMDEETAAFWVEEAEDRALDEVKMEKLCHAVMAVSKPQRE